MSGSDRQGGTRRGTGRGATVEGHSVPVERRSGALGRVVGELVALGGWAATALVHSSVYLAVIAMAEVAIVMALLALPPSPAPLVGALVTFAVYTNDHVADAASEQSERAAFVATRGELWYGLAAVAYSAAVALAVLGGPLALAIVLLPGATWVLYASNVLSGLPDGLGRLKEVLVVNSSLVALAWATSLTLLPLAYAGRPVTAAAGFVLAYFALRSFVDTEIPNVRDVRIDAAAGVATLPVVFGVDRTRRMLYLVDLASAGLLSVALALGLIATVHAVALAIGLAYSLAVVALLGRVDDAKLLAVATEFEYVVVGGVLAVLALAG